MADFSDSIISMLEDTQDNDISQVPDQQTSPPPAPENSELQKQFSGGSEYTRSNDDPEGAIPIAPIDTIETERIYTEKEQIRSTPDPLRIPPSEGGTGSDPSLE